MSRFEFSSGDGLFSGAEKIGKYLTSQLGPRYKFNHQSDELKSARPGPRGDLTRWVNESIFGDHTIVVSNNSLFGTAIRFFPQKRSTLLVVRGIIPNEMLRKTVFPWLTLAVMFGALIGLQNGVGIAIFCGCLPLYFLLPRLCAIPLTGRVNRFLADADACRAAGIDPPPVNVMDFRKASPEQASQFRAFGIAKIILGLATAGWATQYATTQLGRPYTSMLWEDTLFGCSIAAGMGLMFAYVGASGLFLRRIGWIASGFSLVVLCGLCATAWSIVAPRVCPPRDTPMSIQAQETSVMSSSQIKTNQEDHTNRPTDMNEHTNANEE